MQDTIESVLDAANVSNTALRAFVHEWATRTQPDAIEIVSALDNDRLIREALTAGEVHEVIGDRYYARSFSKDTARSEERTFVATSDPNDQGAYNNWRLTQRIKPVVEQLMAGASRGKTMYVVPYLMSPPGSPLADFAAGVELTDSRVVVLHMIRMARVGIEHLESLSDPSHFVRGVHVTGDLANLGHGTPNDKRYFVTVADERLILHFGSSYGGNALLGKIAHGLRQASYDGQASRKFLAEQFMLIGVLDKQTGSTSYICGGFPSASGKTNLAMMVPPSSLASRYNVYFLGDDIAWLWVDPADGKVYAINPEFGVFGVAKDTNEHSNPNAMAAIAPGSQTLFTNTAYNERTRDVWWEGKTPQPPLDVTGWRDWRGDLISDRPPERQRSSVPGDEWSHPNSRFTTTLSNVPNLSPEAGNPKGVPIDAIIFGGRVRDREPLVRALPDVVSGVYDGLTLGAEATFAAEGKEGVLRYDLMSMRPFMSYPEGRYAQRWLDLMGEAREKPVFAHVNWFLRDENNAYLWPGYGDNLRALLWLIDFKAGRIQGNPTPVGVLPRQEELHLDGLSLSPEALRKLLSIDAERWLREVDQREEYLATFPGLPESIWQAHRKIAVTLKR